VTKPAQYIRRDQWQKINANRARISDAREREEREQELMRQLNQQQKTKETVTQI
jgi:hypothetical protein